MPWAGTARTVAGIATLSHDGSTFNAHANVVLIPDGKWGIVLLENAENSADEFFGSRRMSGIADGVTKMVMGHEPGSTHTSPTVYVVYALAFVVLALQLRGITRSVRTFRRWQTQPSQRPHGAWRIARTLVPPLALSLVWAIVVIVALPAKVGAPLAALLMGLPDLGGLLVASATVAVVWSVTKVAWAGWILHSPPGFRFVPTGAAQPA